MQNLIMSEEFGLYRMEIDQEEDGFFWEIHYLDDDGSDFGQESDSQPYSSPLEALTIALSRLGKLFLRDAEILWREAERTKAGNGTRTHDILLGNIPIMSSPVDKAVQE